jgi:hypothetical protein
VEIGHLVLGVGDWQLAFGGCHPDIRSAKKTNRNEYFSYQ